MKDDRPIFLRLDLRPWGLLIAAGAIASLATLLGFLGQFHWLLDLLAHFRVQYAIGLSTVGLLLLIGRRPQTAAAFLALALLNTTLIVPLYLRPPAPVPEKAHHLRAMLLNVNTQGGDIQRVRQAIENIDPDILVLEEISALWIRSLASLTNTYPHGVTEPREDNFGIGLFSKLPLDKGEIAYIGEAAVPSILATIKVDNDRLHVIATHPLPPGGADYSRLRNDQLAQLPSYVDRRASTMLLGDLNVTPWSTHFQRLLDHTGLLNSLQGYGVQPTWPNFSWLLRIPLDHCLHSSNIVINQRRVGPDVGSDHYPVIVDFSFNLSSPAIIGY